MLLFYSSTSYWLVVLVRFISTLLQLFLDWKALFLLLIVVITEGNTCVRPRSITTTNTQWHNNLTPPGRSWNSCCDRCWDWSETPRTTREDRWWRCRQITSLSRRDGRGRPRQQHSHGRNWGRYQHSSCTDAGYGWRKVDDTDIVAIDQDTPYEGVVKLMEELA